MNANIGSKWPLGALALACAWVVREMCVDAQRRRHARQVKEQLLEWENEGGAVPPPRTGSA